MSEPLRVGLITEGPTDRILLMAIIPEILGREVVYPVIHPDDASLALGGSMHGFGWRGVLGWCRDRTDPTGVSLPEVMQNLDILVVHLDGDVAREPEINCAKPCPPASDTADALRERLLTALGLHDRPAWLVLTIPVDATEAWLLPVLRGTRWNECATAPADQFMGGKPKLLEQSGKKVTKRYRDETGNMRSNWPKALVLSQADRFTRELSAAGEVPRA